MHRVDSETGLKAVIGMMMSGMIGRKRKKPNRRLVAVSNVELSNV